MLPPTAKFCDGCGQSLSPSTPPPDYSKPHAYTPKFLADKILTSRSAMEGERKLVTVLFADVANFTSLSEKLDPEEIHGIMDGCFKIAAIIAVNSSSRSEADQCQDGVAQTRNERS
jgi:hypothetical protein